jgi:E3 ubiquitin ligase
VESVLRVDEPVYVLGVVREDGQIGAPAESEREKRFLISYRSEEQLEKKYRRNALWLGLIAGGLLLFGAIFLGVGIAAALGALAVEEGSVATELVFPVGPQQV